MNRYVFSGEIGHLLFYTKARPPLTQRTCYAVVPPQFTAKFFAALKRVTRAKRDTLLIFDRCSHIRLGDVFKKSSHNRLHQPRLLWTERWFLLFPVTAFLYYILL